MKGRPLGGGGSAHGVVSSRVKSGSASPVDLHLALVPGGAKAPGDTLLADGIVDSPSVISTLVAGGQ